MSQENVESVRQYLLAYDEGGTDAWAKFWHPDISWRAIEGALDDIGVMQGRDALRHYYSQWEETFDGIRIELDEVIDAGGDQVVAVVRSVARMKGSEADVDIRYAVVVSIRDGKIAKGREFASREAALEAAGLSG
jgi:ketosteroid isomerase-like protein